ncbi:MAG: hypothetical protein ACK4VO_11335 [Pseudobdellovibrio sp.]
MKKYILFEIYKALKTQPNLMRKFKIFASVGIIILFFVAGVTIWAGYSATKYLYSSANQVINSAQTTNHLDNLKSEIKQLQFQPLNCWGKAQSLLSLQPWFEQPIADIFQNLKLACFDTGSSICVGDECSQIKKLIYTAEEKSI